MLCAACSALAEEAGTKITGNIEDGSFVLTVSLDPEDKGEWRADDTVEDHSVVKLAAAETEDDIFTARYEPAGTEQLPSACNWNGMTWNTLPKAKRSSLNGNPDCRKANKPVE